MATPRASRPTPGYTGVPSFNFTATDAGANADTVLAYDFDLPDAATANVVPDASGNGRDGTHRLRGRRHVQRWAPDEPAALGAQGARSIDLVENGGANAARVQRVLAATELDWNTQRLDRRRLVQAPRHRRTTT